MQETGKRVFILSFVFWVCKCRTAFLRRAENTRTQLHANSYYVPESASESKPDFLFNTNHVSVNEERRSIHNTRPNVQSKVFTLDSRSLKTRLFGRLRFQHDDGMDKREHGKNTGESRGASSWETGKLTSENVKSGEQFAAFMRHRNTHNLGKRSSNDKRMDFERNSKNFLSKQTDERSFYHRIVKRDSNMNATTEVPRFLVPPPPGILPPVAPSPPQCRGVKSCAGRCLENGTDWRTGEEFICYCDSACYEVFNDCCTDYTKYCGVQKAKGIPVTKYNWSCEPAGRLKDTGGCVLVNVDHWMVSRCSADWPDDNIRRKCEQPVDYITVSSPYLDRYLPVLDHDNTTFRNKFCAFCNGVKRYESWPLDIETSVIPPQTYNLTEKVIFLLTHGAKFPPSRPGVKQARRYCLNDITSTCSVGQTSQECVNGPVALITVVNLFQFKNTHCAVCNNYRSSSFSCFPGGFLKTCDFDPRPFSLVLDFTLSLSDSENFQQGTKVSVKENKCAKQGKTFDDILQVCRVNWQSPPEQEGEERFYVLAWIEPPANPLAHARLSAGDYQNSLARHLNFSREQIVNVEITNSTSSVFFFLAGLTIVLNPQQSFELLTTNRNENATLSARNIFNFIYFTTSFTIPIKSTFYTVAKTTSRPLTCISQTVYTAQEYTLLDNERVFIANTNTTYEQFQYYREQPQLLSEKRGNITICEKFSPVPCNGSSLLLTPEEFDVMVNLSIYVKKTSVLYHYGDYEILSNNSVTICLPPRTRNLNKVRKTIRDNTTLGWITFVGFLLSIFLLIFLLITYFAFPHLQTLPGKNLMNLSATLLLFQLFWLPSGFNAVRSHEPSCTAMAILEHYFLMASFAAMSVIAFHTCKVFARKLPAPKASESHARKLFYVYLGLVWALPAVFVIVCVLLDKFDVVRLGYGASEICWMTENDAHIYFVTIPIAILLLFNIIMFVITAIYLRRHSQNRAAKQASGTRQSNVWIYVRLSSLMGFTWLFGFLALVIKPAEVFWYFFVVFTSLQGVFIAAAFVLNSKTLQLYKGRYREYGTSSTPPTTKTFKTNTFDDTRL